MTIVDRYELAESVEWLEGRAVVNTGYACKTCGGPSPIGVGYVVSGEGNGSVDRCPCGQSVAAV